jgi:hypothetical protein
VIFSGALAAAFAAGHSAREGVSAIEVDGAMGPAIETKVRSTRFMEATGRLIL